MMEKKKANFNRLLIITELISLILSIIFKDYLKYSDDIIFKYKYLVIIIVFILLGILKVKTNNDLIIKYAFYINIVLVIGYYLLNAIVYIR